MCMCRKRVHACVKTCLSPAQLSGFCAKDDFISFTQITLYSRMWESPFPLPRCVCACVGACAPHMCVKRRQRRAVAGLRAL